MAKTSKQIIGDVGEQKACAYLVKNGYAILETQYRYKRAEIDIIASKDNFIIFVEVKTRKNNDFGYPEEFVSERKQELFHEAATHYVEATSTDALLRFDIIAITGDEIEHFEDAF